MKKALLITMALAVITLTFYACTKRMQQPDVCTKSAASSMAKTKKAGTKKDNTETTIKCNGSCSNSACSLEGVYSATEHWVQCKCDNCSMQIITKLTDPSGVVTTDTTNLPGGTQITVDYLGHFNAYMAAAYPGQTYSITGLYTDEDEVHNNYIVQYEYVTAAGETGSILYENESDAGKNISVDCKGKCDCRERYFPKTGAVECTCNDCQMEIRDLPDAK